MWWYGRYKKYQNWTSRDEYYNVWDEKYTDGTNNRLDIAETSISELKDITEYPK